MTNSIFQLVLVAFVFSSLLAIAQERPLHLESASVRIDRDLSTSYCNFFSRSHDYKLVLGKKSDQMALRHAQVQEISRSNAKLLGSNNSAKFLTSKEQIDPVDNPHVIMSPSHFLFADRSEVKCQSNSIGFLTRVNGSRVNDTFALEVFMRQCNERTELDLAMY